MTAQIRGFLLVCLLGLSIQGAHAKPWVPPLPTNETLAQLLSYESRILVQHITIGVVVRGEAQLDKKFGTDHAIHVTFIWPVPEDGRRVRKVETRTFLWNEEYGWFSFVISERRGGPAIDVCSEKLGMIEVR